MATPQPDVTGRRPVEKDVNRAFDTVVDVETPEAVTLRFRVAGPIPRAFAFFIDGAIRLTIYGLLALAVSGAGQFGFGLFLILLFFAEWFYPVAFEVWMRGMTPGKRLLGLQVVHDNGTPVGWSGSLIRNLLRFADFLPILWLFGLFSMLLNPHFKRLGDLAGGTLVVYREQQTNTRVRPNATAIRLEASLTAIEQRAVVDFAERAHELTDERAEELARIAVPLMVDGESGAGRLYGIANAIAGRE
ncbi:MAG: RDD family protein [Pseudomonadota bacterium]